MKSTEKQKQSIRFGLWLGKGVVLGALSVSIAGCVVDPYPSNYYRSYPADYSYRDYSQPYYYPGSSVTLDFGGDDHHGPDRRDQGNYDQRGDTGRNGPDRSGHGNDDDGNDNNGRDGRGR